MKCFGDLHVHSTASDGILLPEELLQRADNKNLSYMALADHDTLLGTKKLMENNNSQNVQVVPAVEITSDYKDGEIHILGYFIDIYSKKLNETLKTMRSERTVRIEKMIGNLSDLGCEISKKNVFKNAGAGTVGRPHIARELVNYGYVNDVVEAFDRYLAKDKPAYVPREKLTPKEAIDLIKNNGGVAVWAHPGLVKSPYEYLLELIDLGIQGVELYHPSHSINFEIEWKKLCEDKELLITGGSDFHEFNDLHSDDIGVKGISCNHIEKLKKRSYIGPMD
ncbi:PHP domain-containing protein [Natranaerobius trueperi]|uniref:Polymerase/histidinol phosphatase N-terminal domain-containing protein n=1 Tax=Natranaerobius trueperi TaxID=759412 RepID=A0A226BY99_9FIRM|nr:PHP domain-containing protein [Natranaerobius trueperi]OWZ83110.1 hypothetical protein CDO51_10440 [Natranaerobius trueperi]